MQYLNDFRGLGYNRDPPGATKRGRLASTAAAARLSANPTDQVGGLTAPVEQSHYSIRISFKNYAR